ncbi:class A beta-lactamase-related serine hydrolase [Streptococcus chenjunshii]|uniref:Class A beta-lactamase-related serine hydrolase n=1 Tax=Streptococcus chenjunshii TaxID=2173853 RepID=A0A372KNN3_9STRE|nr:serine hydrolase domain-containing protein [Streptococcus chenjunshii]AXQ77955.1 class A beta-lactamase-related serine hydrolase [Streptococcus chenjunshii]RFU51801.1 class A beta-lactamase-related serine hydrolase [Streptococcus chenjunshii]RFU53889.1 class A beta-lactamase-related serine hydrolase [Streptococcus chenjunshii]
MTEIFLKTINSQIKDGLYHGASLAVYQQGAWQEYYIGTIDGAKPVKPGLIYDLASVSKVVGTGTVCIFLLNKGSFKLDDALQAYYPDFHDASLSIRQLLTHTSGIDPYIPNRNQMKAQELQEAVNRIALTADKRFKYTDINFLLLGFMLEKIYSQSLAHIFQKEVFSPFKMKQTSFGPVKNAVPTQKGVNDGQVHDPKAKILGRHAGSAGLFSTLIDLEIFLEHYLQDDFAAELWHNYGSLEKPRSLAWNLEGDWLDHTGYTGPFIMVNRSGQQAAIFLTNRTYEGDARSLWKKERRKIKESMISSFK